MFKWILGFLLGACSLVVQPSTLQTASTLLTLVIAGALFLLVKRVKHLLLSACIVIISGFLFGVGWTSIHASWRLSQQIPSPENQSVHIIEAEVKSLPVIYPEYCKFTVVVKHSETAQLKAKKLQLGDYSKHCPYKLGDRWQMTIKLKPIHGPLNEAGFDYEFFMFQQAIDGKGYVKQANHISEPSSLSIGQVRQSVFDALQGLENDGLFQALFIGEKSSIPKQDKETLRQLGLSHLIAISGLHISIIAGGSFWLMFAALGRINRLSRSSAIEPLRPALLFSCVIALLYSALADFSIPTVRAMIMWCCVSFAVLLQRQSALLSGLKLSLGLILLFDPLSVLSASFWMSFIAVAVIALLISGRVSSSKGFKQHLFTLGKVQVGISLTLVLPSILFFQQATLLGLLVNIIVIPLFSIIVLPLIIGVVLLTLSGVHRPIEGIDSVISSSMAFLKTIAEQFHWMTFDVWLPTSLIICLFIALLFIGLPLGKLRYPFIFLTMTLMWSYHLSQSFVKREPTMVVFDVGHGLSVLLTDGESNILYDTGYAAAHGSAFRSYIEPTLRMLDIQSLDILILSHQDNDHAGATQDIIQRLPVGRLIAGQWAKSLSEGLSWTDCTAGLRETVGAFMLEVLHPNDSTKGRNNDSCVIKVTANLPDNDFSVLLTGDIEKGVEYQLAELHPESLSADILLVPHHGSNSSSSYPFLKMVDPALAIHSTERFSRYNLPSDAVIKRYQNFRIAQIHTGCYGQITYFLTQKRYKMARESGRIWRLQPCEVVEK